MERFDVIVIGAGPGGYVAAIRASQLGLKTACIEKYEALGGTCLNVGCIPSKALLTSSELYHQALEKFSAHGIECNDVKLNWPKMLKRKDAVVSNISDGVNYLFKKNNITRIFGTASFVDANSLQVIKPDKSRAQYFGKNIIIATGSKPTELPFMPFDGKCIISSTHALGLKKVPKDLIVIGAGSIGLELGSVYCRLGSNVTVLEACDRLLPRMDKEVGTTMHRILKKQGLEFHLETKVSGHTIKGGRVSVTAETKKGDYVTFEADHVLVAIGRRPFTGELNVAAAGVTLDDRGFINVNGDLQTDAPSIYAVGDVIGGWMLAHEAEEEGIYAVEHIGEAGPQFNRDVVPGVVYTWPEVAAVGKNEEELKASKTPYKVGKFPFRASGRAVAAEEVDGFIKVLIDPETEEILGVHMIGPRCSDMIAEAVMAMEFQASAEDIGMMIHAHPTFT
ncbi:dihydrolipoyl dehydrogenase, partial [bacterium F16]